MVFPVQDYAGVAVLMNVPFADSFLGFLILRLPRGLPVVLGRSHSKACGLVLTAHGLVPLISLSAFLGRCRHCGIRVPVFHLAIELVAICVAPLAMVAFSGTELWLWCVLEWRLLTLALIDVEWILLPPRCLEWVVTTNPCLASHPSLPRDVSLFG